MVAGKGHWNGSTIPVQVPTPNAKLAARGTKSTCIIASLVLRQSQPNDEESCIVLESGPTCRNSAKLLQHSSLAVHKFHIIIEKCCEQDYGWVCAKPCCQMLWRLKHIRMIAAMYMSSAHLISIY